MRSRAKGPVPPPGRSQYGPESPVETTGRGQKGIRGSGLIQCQGIDFPLCGKAEKEPIEHDPADPGGYHGIQLG